ncbi:MAG: alpha/beta fold hydrolase [Halohasta sp.]
MEPSTTRRRALQCGGVALAAGVAGCLGGESPEGTLDVDGLDRINETTLPDRRKYRTRGGSFPEYRQYTAEDADTVVILLHTAGFDSRVLQPLAAAIADAGAAHVFTPDLRGHGPEPERRGDVDYIGQYEDDLEQLIRNAELVFPDAEIVVGGHGAGGGIGVRFARPPLGRIVDGYLLLAPLLGLDAETTREGLGGWASFYMDRIVMLRVLTGFGLEDYSDMTTAEFDLPESGWNGTPTPEHSYRLMASYLPEGDGVESMVEVPTLTVVGEADETAHAEAYEPLFADHPVAEVELLDGVTHLETVLSEAAVDPIVEWLDGALER